jgi:hypothetical protein
MSGDKIKKSIVELGDAEQIEVGSGKKIYGMLPTVNNGVVVFDNTQVSRVNGTGLEEIFSGIICRFGQMFEVDGKLFGVGFGDHPTKGMFITDISQDNPKSFDYPVFFEGDFQPGRDLPHDLGFDGKTVYVENQASRGSLRAFDLAGRKDRDC